MPPSFYSRSSLAQGFLAPNIALLPTSSRFFLQVESSHSNQLLWCGVEDGGRHSKQQQQNISYNLQFLEKNMQIKL